MTKPRRRPRSSEELRRNGPQRQAKFGTSENPNVPLPVGPHGAHHDPSQTSCSPIDCDPAVGNQRFGPTSPTQRTALKLLVPRACVVEGVYRG
ncbi:hypothetical protein A1Q2_02152 [Trichosporon asahii var. asahii CBS 8904]|uniref:Uncharacterized protein n=1 Tax=Trichosporon asahii var. asahii (strain CBS 8904) TaxID=1220162 RepID=K1WRA9_TRIAC|nr:hypothetical protein A1Q2_02152 [Trichosporon asahii var. asahii CBS 8904]